MGLLGSDNSAALRHVFLASLRRRRLATALSLLAIALGVALGLAVQLIHTAALDELDRGMRLLSGEADLQVVGPRSGFDDALYARIALHPAVAAASPLLEIQARLPGRDETLRVFGIDLFRVAQVTLRCCPWPRQQRRRRTMPPKAPTRIDPIDSLHSSPMPSF
jgi:putative ABC transport system permease protein